MADTYRMKAPRRAEYVREIAQKAFFVDEDYTIPRYDVPFQSPTHGLRGLAKAMADLVTSNFTMVKGVSDQKWMRMARAQFAIVDDELVQDTVEEAGLVEAVDGENYGKAGTIACRKLKDKGYCISVGDSSGGLTGFGLPIVDPSGGGMLSGQT